MNEQDGNGHSHNATNNRDRHKSNADPSAHFHLLGITNSNVSPFGVLGISPDDCARESVMRALRTQLAKLDRHPEGQTDAAHQLRRTLRRIADELMTPGSREDLRARHYSSTIKPVAAPASSPPPPLPKQTSEQPAPTPTQAPKHATGVTASKFSTSPPPVAPTRSQQASVPPPRQHGVAPVVPRVTSMDRDLTMAIVSSGGWNHRARQRVAAVALDHHIQSDDLLGLVLHAVETVGDDSLTYWAHPHARPQPSPSVSPGRPQEVPSIAPANRMLNPGHLGVAASNMTVSVSPPAQAAGPGHGVGWDDRTDEEVEHETTMRNLSVAVLGFFLGLLFIIPLGVYVITEINSKPDLVPFESPSSSSTNSAGGSAIGVDPTDDSTSTNTRSTRATNATRSNTRSPLAVTITTAVESLDQAIRSSDTFTPALQDDFAHLMDQTRHAWTRFDIASLERIRRFVISVLYERGVREADASAILEMVDPSTLGRTSGPMQPAAFASVTWSNAMVFALASEHDLPAASTRVIQSHVQRRPANQRIATAARTQGMTFAESGALVLAMAVPRFLTDDAPQSVWSVWQEAVHTLAADNRAVEDALLQALYRVMTEGQDPQASELVRALIDDLMRPIEWTSSVDARRTLLAWFADPRIAASDIAAVTAFLVNHTNIIGLNDSFVLSPNASSVDRAQLRDRMSTVWRSARPNNAINATDVEVSQWLAHAQRISTEPIPVVMVDQLEFLVQLSRLAEAAYLLTSADSAAAQLVLESMDQNAIDAQIVSAQQAIRSQTLVGDMTPPANDGEWSIQFAAAAKANDRTGREILLQDLLSIRHQDLGPIDATTLITTAHTGSPRALRQMAIDVIISRFKGSPQVILRLVDTLPPDRPSRAISKLIEEITGTPLPDYKSKSWYADARFVLVNHLLQLLGQPAESVRINAISRLLAQSYSMRGGQDSQTIEAMTDPAVGAQSCYEGWIMRGRPMMPILPVPAPLHDIERRLETRKYFQRDPVGAFGAVQQGVLEVMIYVTCAERPTTAPELLQLLDDLNDETAGANTSIEQRILTERAILQVWMMRIRFEWGMTR